MYKNFFFIVFEGIEGSGKSSHSLSLIKKLKSLKIPCVYLREPGGSKNAEYIRNFLLKNENKEFNSLTDTLLYFAARNENFLKKIKPFYKKKIIICDRFIDSTTAYQIYGKGVNKHFINSIHKYILKGLKPDLTFILISNISKAFKRMNKRKSKNRYDKFSANFYKKVQKAFVKIGKSNMKRYVILDNSKDTPEIEKIILKKIIKLLNK